MSFLKHLFSEQRAVTYQDVWASGSDLSFGSSTATGVRVTPLRALQSITVWACARLIAGTIATLPTASFVRNGAVRDPYPRPLWMFNPNPEMLAVTFWEQFITSLLLYGDGYAYVVRDNDATVLELWPLHPDNVDPRRDGPNRRLRYHVIDDVTGQSFTLTPGVDILHVPGFSLPGAVTGLNPIAYARQAIGLGLATEELGARFFSQGSTAEVVLEAEQEVSDTALRKTAAMWKKTHTGLKNAHYPAVLQGGLKAKTLSIPNDQSQFLETRGFQRSEIASFFAVPPHMIGDVDRSTSWGTGIEAQGTGFVVYTLRTWLERMEQGCSVLFPPGSRAFLKFNVEGLLRGDTKSRYESYGIGIDRGFLSVDEVRALEDRPPVPGGKGQSFRQPLNFGPLGEPTPPKGAGA